MCVYCVAPRDAGRVKRRNFWIIAWAALAELGGAGRRGAEVETGDSAS